MRTGEDSAEAKRHQRGLVVTAGVLMQVGLGSAYAWSTLRRRLSDRFGWSIPEVNLTFSIMILTAGLAAFLGGLWMERAGPRMPFAAHRRPKRTRNKRNLRSNKRNLRCAEAPPPPSATSGLSQPGRESGFSASHP